MLDGVDVRLPHEECNNRTRRRPASLLIGGVLAGFSRLEELNFGANGGSVTTFRQLEKLRAELGQLVEERQGPVLDAYGVYLDDPLAFIREELGGEPWLQRFPPEHCSPTPRGGGRPSPPAHITSSSRTNNKGGEMTDVVKVAVLATELGVEPDVVARELGEDMFRDAAGWRSAELLVAPSDLPRFQGAGSEAMRHLPICRSE